MTLRNLKNAARKGAWWLLLSLPFTVALVFSSAFSAAFGAPKNAILIGTAFALGTLAVTFGAPGRLVRAQRAFRAAAALYLAVTVLSALLSQNISMCMEGVGWAACGVVLFAATCAALAGEERARKIRNLEVAIAAAGTLVALLTVLQFMRVDLQGVFGLYANSTGRMRMYATLGNPDFVAAFLAVAVPAALELAVMAARGRGLWFTASALMGGAILLTGSRGGVLALAAGGTVFALTGMRGRAGGKAAVLAAVLAACAVAAGTQLNARTPWESLRGRFFIWQVSLGDGAAQSALGEGPGRFSCEYPARLGRFLSEPGRSELLRFSGHERHAQNDFVEAWHDTGWLGLGALLALLGAWFAIAVRRLRASEPEGRPGIVAGIAAVTALCVASLVDFPMHRAETWGLLWLWMAITVATDEGAPCVERRLIWQRVAIVGLLLLTGACLALAPLAASYEVARGEREESQGRLEESRRAYWVALRWEPWSPEANFNLVRTLAKAGENTAALEQSRAAARYVNEPELYLLRSRILQNAGRNSEAVRELESAERLFPYSAELRDEAVSNSMQ